MLHKLHLNYKYQKYVSTKELKNSNIRKFTKYER